MATSSPSPLVFPHPVLTPITGRPTNTTLQTLQKQLYANARAVHSTRGGGLNGHLALVMPDAAYLARTTVPFAPPVHPGVAPVHAAGATGPAITETNRQYAADLNEHTRYLTVGEELKKQVLTAVATRYLSILEDAEFGYADVGANAMLAHLQETYGAVTNEEIEANRSQLSADWNPDEPMEDLWLRLHECQRYAMAAGEAIPDAAAIRLTLAVLEKTGVFITACEKWRDRPDAEWTLVNLKAHFKKADQERIRVLTARGAGYHGAHAAVESPTPLVPVTAAAAIAVTPPARPVRVNGPVQMYYCWTHGLGKNRAHTSMTCDHKDPGHQDEATAANMMGGCNLILRGGRPSRTRTAAG
jgi:hypothetical protein